MIHLKGSQNSWGLVAKILHWVMAVFILLQIFFGINLHFMNASSEKGELIHFHKIFGTIILFLIFFRLAWKFYNPRPSRNDLNTIHRISSNFVHIILYLLIIIIPIQGMMITWTGGSDVIFLGLFTLPRLVEEDLIMYDNFVNAHFFMTMILCSVFSIHLLGSLVHVIIYKDKYNVWRSMNIFQND